MAEHPIKRHDEEPNEFVRSVIKLSPDDITKKKGESRSPLSFLLDHLRIVVFCICLAVMIWSGFYLIDTLQQYAEAEDMYDSLVDMVVGNAGLMEPMSLSSQSFPTRDHKASQDSSGGDIDDPIIPQRPVINKEYERIRNQLEALKKQYPDLYGWIVLEGTVINYPIMQAKDNDYYLDHSYKGTKLKAGAIFADYRNSRTLMQNKNLVLYGHHMSNNTMFHSLDKFLAKSFFETNNIVKIYTLDGMFTYQVFSVYETNMYYRYIQTVFKSAKDVDAFVNEIAENSIHKASGVTLNGDSRILTLSTCTNRSEIGRLAVHAVMIDSYIANP